MAAPEPGGCWIDLAALGGEAKAEVLGLWERGDAEVERDGTRLWLPREVLWPLSADRLQALGVASFQGQVRVLEEGFPGTRRYRWVLQWAGGAGTVQGCWWLGEGQAPALLGRDLVALSGLAERVAGAPRAAIYRAILGLQALARRCPQVLPPPRLAARRILEATTLRIEVEGPPSDPQPVARVLVVSAAAVPVEPVPPAGPVLSEEATWGPAEAPEPAAEPEVLHTALPLDNLVARATADSVVDLGDDAFVVIPAAVYRGYVLTRAAAEQPREVRLKFVENPTAFLPDPDVFDEVHYSQRVRGIGEAPSRSTSRPTTSRTWVEPTDGLLIDAPLGPIWVPQDLLAELAARVQAGVDAGASQVLWEGQAIPAHPDIAACIARAATRAGASEVPGQGKRRPNILRIRENEVVLEWAPVRGSGRAPHAPALPPLHGGQVLQAHQRQALAILQHLWVRGETGALLCDDMGLGKTTQALVFASWVQRQQVHGVREEAGEGFTVPVMVVAPPSLLEAWLKELETRLPADQLARVIWGGDTLPEARTRREVRLLRAFRADEARSGPQVVAEHARLDLGRLRAYAPDVLLVGYDTLRSLQFAIGALRFALVIADEAQAVKNPGSLRSHALRAMNYDFALALTGTPIENTWEDIWTLCDFATPGRLGTLEEFRKTYPVRGDVRAVGGRLAHTLSEVLIRRTRAATLRGLPPCDFSSVLRAMPPSQALAYRAEASRARSARILGLLQGLARVSLHPRLRAELAGRVDARQWLNESARTQVLLEALTRWEAEGQAVLVFVRSLAAQETLARALALCFDLPQVEVLNGACSFGERQRRVGRLEQAEGFRVLLVSPDVGGAGWNLQFAARSALLERPFNPSVEAQMVARTWRLGQRQRVEVVAPVAVLEEQESFDQVLDGLLQEKRVLAESVLAPVTVGDEELAARFARLRV